jgi:excisionase family DNA binding protein
VGLVSSEPSGIEGLIAKVVREELQAQRLQVVDAVREALRAEVAAPRPDWLSAADVASELGVVVATVRAWVKEGRLRAAGGTRHLRIHRRDLEAMLNGSREDTGEKVEALADRLRRIR